MWGRVHVGNVLRWVSFFPTILHANNEINFERITEEDRQYVISGKKMNLEKLCLFVTCAIWYFGSLK